MFKKVTPTPLRKINTPITQAISELNKLNTILKNGVSKQKLARLLSGYQSKFFILRYYGVPKQNFVRFAELLPAIHFACNIKNIAGEHAIQTYGTVCILITPMINLSSNERKLCHLSRSLCHPCSHKDITLTHVPNLSNFSDLMCKLRKKAALVIDKHGGIGVQRGKNGLFYFADRSLRTLMDIEQWLLPHDAAIIRQRLNHPENIHAYNYKLMLAFSAKLAQLDKIYKKATATLVLNKGDSMCKNTRDVLLQTDHYINNSKAHNIHIKNIFITAINDIKLLLIQLTAELEGIKNYDFALFCVDILERLKPQDKNISKLKATIKIKYKKQQQTLHTHNALMVSDYCSNNATPHPLSLGNKHKKSNEGKKYVPMNISSRPYNAKRKKKRYKKKPPEWLPKRGGY
ncbi:MAG: hypothetical protein JKY13_01520 [Gammaproteobacteria bacterium]|nr:hypothetical protein [Gammaproteobacteria bacterium]